MGKQPIALPGPIVRKSRAGPGADPRPLHHRCRQKQKPPLWEHWPLLPPSPQKKTVGVASVRPEPRRAGLENLRERQESRWETDQRAGVGRTDSVGRGGIVQERAVAWPLGDSHSLPSRWGWVTLNRSLLSLGVTRHLSDEGCVSVNRVASEVFWPLTRLCLWPRASQCDPDC